MPGRTPHEAVERYLDPIREVLGCLDGVAHVDRTGGRLLHGEGAWVVNGGSGIDLARVGVLQARQRFRVVECDPAKHDTSEGMLRVTTLAYDYQLNGTDGQPRWKMHWHPIGHSDVIYPHLHLPGVLTGHRATSRMLVEHAVRWAHNDGAEMRRDDWADVLMMSEAHHVLYRTWSSVPETPAT